MALKPENQKHAKQIEAGIVGRNRGHKFESILTDSINNINMDSFNIITIEHINQHLHIGNPALYLLKYILNKYRISHLDNIKAWWVGALATSGKGDLLLDDNGNAVSKCKSDVVIKFSSYSDLYTTGISVKTCSKPSPTNDQLYFTTAQAFCKLLRDNGIKITDSGEKALKMFCGDTGYRPIDLLTHEQLSYRQSDPERWFWEELPLKGKNELEYIMSHYQNDITLILLQKAYKNDPFAPEFILHQTIAYSDFNTCPIALFSINELIDYSSKFSGFTTNTYQVRKGRFRGDPNIHHAPRFGYVQFQRGGQKQHPTQLQFNLQAGYFNKLPK